MMILLPYLLAIASSEQFAADFVFRMHNHSGWFGPKTKFDGYSGVLLPINSESEIDSVFSVKRKYPEVIVLPLTLLRDDIISRISSMYTPKPFLQGFIITNDDSTVRSAGLPFPNKQYASYEAPEDFVWNQDATSMIQHSYDFPIVYPPKSEVQRLLKHIEDYGTKAGVYMRIYMLTRGDTKKCLKNSNCQILGGLSIYGSFNEEYAKPGVWAIAGFDTYGFFPYAHVGADYSISGFVALLAALESLKGIDWSTATKHLRYAFFDAEEWGYLGSTRFLDDIISFNCNSWKNNGEFCNSPYRIDFGFETFDLNAFDTVIEIKSVANANTLYVHTNQDKRDFGRQIVSRAPGPMTLEMADENLPGIPPSSTNTFIRKKPGINHAVLTGYQSTFPRNNKIGFPSEVDYNVDSITNSAQTLANILAAECGVTPVHNVNRTIVEGLMIGLVNAPNDSQYLKELFPTSDLPTDHVSLYSGPFKYYTLDLKQLIIREILKDPLATKRTSTPCESDNDCGGLSCSASKVCINYTMNMHPAYSAAFEYDDNEGEIVVINDSIELPFETEANWDSPDLQYVTLPSYWSGRVVAGIGILLWILLSALFCAFWNHNLEYLQK